MLVSLVVCTRNRSAQLAQCLDHILTLDRPDSSELIVVDNGSVDATQDIIRRYESSAWTRLVTEPKPSLSRARNRGWRAAHGDIVVFTDDDCYPRADFLNAAVRSFSENTSLGFIGGRVLLHDPKDARVTIKENESPEEFSPSDFMYAGAVHGANFAFRRAALESVGGFDERFGAGTRFSSAEDIEITARVLAAGWYGAYDPRVVVSHAHGRRSRDAINALQRQYDRGRGAYYAKCILNPKLRDVYSRHWYWAMRSQPLGRSAREAIAAIRFLLHASGRLSPPHLDGGSRSDA